MRTWRFDPVALAGLQEALTALDGADEAGKIVEREGMVLVSERSGAKKPHPAIAVQRMYLATFRQLMAALKLQPPV